MFLQSCSMAFLYELKLMNIYTPEVRIEVIALS
jgi:hypothetical protein